MDPYWCQDAFPGLVGPFRATGGRFRAIFHIFRMYHIFPEYFSYFPIIPRCGRPIIPRCGFLLFPGVAQDSGGWGVEWLVGETAWGKTDKAH